MKKLFMLVLVVGSVLPDIDFRGNMKELGSAMVPDSND